MHRTMLKSSNTFFYVIKIYKIKCALYWVICFMTGHIAWRSKLDFVNVNWSFQFYLNYIRLRSLLRTSILWRRFYLFNVIWCPVSYCDFISCATAHSGNINELFTYLLLTSFWFVLFFCYSDTLQYFFYILDRFIFFFWR